MNFNKILLLVIFSILFLASHTLSQPDDLDINDLNNLTYTIHPSSDRPMKVKLFNGRYSRRDALEDFVITWVEKTATGDLDGDGRGDAAVILFSNYGGSGSFAELAAVVNKEGRLHHVASAFLGDRVVIKSLAIKDGVISVDILTHGPKDPMATPTLRKTGKFKLVDKMLVKQ